MDVPGLTDAVVDAIETGEPVLLPTDTVYGLCTTPHTPEAAERLYRLKGREARQPVAIVVADFDALLACIPELRGRAERIARALLPGPYTLVLANPARRYPWLTGSHPDRIGVRIPKLPPATRGVLDRVGAVAATSANLAGGPDPSRLEDVPEALRAACAAELDAGELPGTPSTVIDFTGPEPRVLREGAAASAEAIRLVEGL